MKQVGNTILAKGVNHILAKRDNSAWPKGSKLSGFSTYQQQVKQKQELSVEKFIDTDPTKISWTVNLKRDMERAVLHTFNSDIRYSMYRPFSKQQGSS